MAGSLEERVRELLSRRKRHLAALARVLRDKETLDADLFKKLLATPLHRRPAAKGAKAPRGS